MNDFQKPRLSARIPRFVRRFLWGGIAVVGIAAIVGSFFVGRHSVYRLHPEIHQAEQAQAILARVGTLIALPAYETPQMATIEDANGLKKEQPFLANAENGDVLIVYPMARQAMLYRPATNMLVAVGPVDSTPPQNNPVIPSPAVTPTATSSYDATTTHN